MHRLYELKEQLIDELCEHGEKGLTKESLHEVDTLAHAAKNLCKVIASCEDDKYSGRYYPMYSGRRRRDAMGRFTSRDEAPDHGVAHAMAGGNKEQVINMLESYLHTDADERTRGRVRELIRDMRNA